MMFCVKEGGKSRFLTEKEWEALQSRTAAGGREGVQKIYSEVEEMVKKEEGIVGQKLKVREKDLIGVDCGEELLRLVNASGDPDLVVCLSQEQREAMEEAGRRQSERVRSKVEELVQERLKEERRGTEASPMLKVRIVDARQEEATNGRCSSGLLTVWRPTGEADVLREGRFVGVTGAVVNRVAGHTVHLTAGRHSQYLELEGGLVEGGGAEDELSRALTPLSTICRPKFSPIFYEVDLVGLVVRVEEGTKGSFLTMFVTRPTRSTS